MKFVNSIFDLMNSKLGSFFDFLCIALAVGQAIYEFGISQDPPDAFSWLILALIPVSIFFAIKKPSVALGKMVGVKPKKED